MQLHVFTFVLKCNQAEFPRRKGPGLGFEGLEEISFLLFLSVFCIFIFVCLLHLIMKGARGVLTRGC